MAKGLRERMYQELENSLKEEGIVTLIRFVKPENGETIKLKGKILFKRILAANPWKENGIVIHSKILDSALAGFGGKRIGKKNTWAGCPLTHRNYDEIFEALMMIAKAENSTRDSEIRESIVKRKKQEKENKKKASPKKINIH